MQGDQQLWIAFKLVSLYRKEQSIAGSIDSLSVVNCFQISIFIPKGTIVAQLLIVQEKLWIAFKLVSLYRKEQS